MWEILGRVRGDEAEDPRKEGTFVHLYLFRGRKKMPLKRSVGNGKRKTEESKTRKIISFRFSLPTKGEAPSPPLAVSFIVRENRAEGALIKVVRCSVFPCFFAPIFAGFR